MWADWHAHYPMHVVSDVDPDPTFDPAVGLMRKVRGRKLGAKVQAAVLWLAMRLGSDKTLTSGPRISIEGMRKGDVGLALSVLLRAFEEIDLGKPYAAAPTPDYFPGLIEDMDEVEAEVATHGEATIRFVKNVEQLDRALEAKAIALVHAVEGGFHLGDSDEEIARNCRTLGQRGVGYVTVAHLFFRQVATNAPALPFLPDPLYNFVFPQHGKDRLTPRGEAVVRGLVCNRILIDLSHMDPPGIREVFDLLDNELDPEAKFPVVSTHAGYRFGKQQYMCDEEILLKIKRRGGLVGLIMAQHQLNDGLRKHKDYTTTLDESFAVICAHIDKIAEITGGYEHIALGSDFDGFIKPTMGGLETMADLAALERKLEEKYGPEATASMTSGNSLRVLRTLWSQPAISGAS
jgi:microsomal dipeptidase-like Zn-dependent dipeptidase